MSHDVPTVGVDGGKAKQPSAIDALIPVFMLIGLLALSYCPLRQRCLF